jgi:hypothetical protein
LTVATGIATSAVWRYLTSPSVHLTEAAYYKERYATDSAGLRTLYIELQNMRTHCRIMELHVTDSIGGGLRLLGEEGEFYYKLRLENRGWDPATDVRLGLTFEPPLHSPRLRVTPNLKAGIEAEASQDSGVLVLAVDLIPARTTAVITLQQVVDSAFNEGLVKKNQLAHQWLFLSSRETGAIVPEIQEDTLNELFWADGELRPGATGLEYTIMNDSLGRLTPYYSPHHWYQPTGRAKNCDPDS